MSNTIYVGNLAWGATEESLKEFFSPVGEVSSVKIITDRETGKSRGFAFVTMENSAQAIQEFNGKEFMERPLKINEATDKPPQREFQPREPQREFQPREPQSAYANSPRVEPSFSPKDNSGQRREWGQRRDSNFKRRERNDY